MLYQSPQVGIVAIVRQEGSVLVLLARLMTLQAGSEPEARQDWNP